MSPSAGAVELEGVSLALGGRTVLSEVDAVIRDTEFIGLLGANGSGKTTLFRALLGLVAPTAGRIRVLGMSPAAARRHIGYMPQVRGAVADIRLTGWEFVASAAGGHRWGLPILGADDRRDVERAVELVGAGDLARRPVQRMSGGERQRLMLAQALLGNPRLLLLDEPLISLDPGYQATVVELARRLQQELGIAVLFSAHELNPLLGALDRVLYLGHGRAALGRVDEVVTGPVLSRLYGVPIDVVRVQGRIFVMSDGHEVEHDAHRHQHDHSHA